MSHSHFGRQKRSYFAALVVAVAFTLFVTSEAKAQFYINCGQTVSQGSLPISLTCSDTTAFGSYSTTAKIALGTGEIIMGSNSNWNASDPNNPGPSSGAQMEAHFVTTVASGTLPVGTPLLLKTYFAAEGTHGTSAYGGTYSYNFTGNYFARIQLFYNTWLNINHTVVIADDGCTATNCPQPQAMTEVDSTGPGQFNGQVSAGPRTGTYQTTVGSQLEFDWEYNNTFNYGGSPVGTFSYKLDPGLTFAASDPTTGAPISGLSLVLSDGTVIPINNGAVNYSCTGFQSPFNAALALNRKTNRAIPLKAQVFDSNHNLVTPTTLGTAAPPIVNVSYNSGAGAATDDTSLLDPLGQSSAGNQFSFDLTTGTWWFNLATSPFTASGTYTVTMQSGDSTQYQLSPQCSGSFVRQ